MATLVSARGRNVPMHYGIGALPISLCGLVTDDPLFPAPKSRSRYHPVRPCVTISDEFRRRSTERSRALAAQLQSSEISTLGARLRPYGSKNAPRREAEAGMYGSHTE